MPGLIALTLASGALFAVGCGDSDSDSSSTSTPAATSAETTASTTASTTKDVTGKKIAYVEIFLQAPIEKRVNDVFNAAADKFDWDVNTTDAKGDGQTVSQQFTAAINSNVDAIVTSAEPLLVRGPLEAAKKKNIPVIYLGGENTHGLDNLITGLYNEDDTALSDILGKKICEDNDPGTKVAILRFDLFYSGKIRGDVIKKMAEACGLDVVAEPATEQTFADAEQKTSAVVTQNPDLGVVVPVYDTFTAGAVQAIKAAGKADQTKVYSYYADGVNNPLMRDNKNIVALTDTTHGYGAAYAVDRLAAYFANGEAIPKSPPKGLIGYQIITQDNIPPEGQDGPLPVQDYVDKFLPDWQQEYGIK
ncbi:MAG: sugar ABC transporter substrate-binding protein [Solirubrobacteraceae bacterium]